MTQIRLVRLSAHPLSAEASKDIIDVLDGKHGIELLSSNDSTMELELDSRDQNGSSIGEVIELVNGTLRQRSLGLPTPQPVTFAALGETKKVKQEQPHGNIHYLVDAIPVWLDLGTTRQLKHRSISHLDLDAGELATALDVIFRDKNGSLCLVCLDNPVSVSPEQVVAIVDEARAQLSSLRHPATPVDEQLVVDWDLVNTLALEYSSKYEIIPSEVNGNESLVDPPSVVALGSPEANGIHDIDPDLITRIGVSGEERQEAIDLYLSGLAEVTGRIANLNGVLERGIAGAREAGISWQKIGQAVGLSASAAHRRWDPEARRKHAEYRRNQEGPSS